MRQESGFKGVPTEMLVLGWQAAGYWLLHKKGKGAGDSELSLTVVLTPLKGGQGWRQCRSPRACSPGTAGCVHYCGLPPRPDLAPPTACTLSAATAGPVTAPTNTTLKASTRNITRTHTEPLLQTFDIFPWAVLLVACDISGVPRVSIMAFAVLS